MIGFLLALLVFGWAFYGLHVIGLNQAVLEDISKPLAKWFSEPGNNVRALVALVSLLVAVIALWSDSNSYIGQFKGDMLSIAIAVIVIDELASYRSRLERKQEIIEQIESPVRDAAVEAVRLARKYAFLDQALKKARLSSAKLDGADLGWVNLQGAYLYRASLKGAFLRMANLENSDLERVDLSEADLVCANLQNANLTWADLRKTKLWGASLKGADLTSATVTMAIYDESTRWPDGFDPEEAGAVLV